MIIANGMLLNETVFRSRSSEKIMSMINQENFTAFILTRIVSQKSMYSVFNYLIFSEKIVSPICNSKMGECPVHLKVPEQKNQMSLTLVVVYLPQLIIG